MNGIDLAILIVLGLFLIKGVWRGLIHQLCAIVGIVLGTFLAWSFTAVLGPELAHLTGWSSRPSLAVVAALLFFSGVLALMVLRFYLDKAAKKPVLAELNRISGGLFGLIEGVVLLAVVIYLLTLWPMVARQPVVKSATLTPPFIRLGGVILCDTQADVGKG